MDLHAKYYKLELKFQKLNRLLLFTNVKAEFDNVVWAHDAISLAKVAPSLS